MRKRRTIYFEDGRHYYLYIFEPPISLEDARMPIDQVAGTAVDTFIYGVTCRGLFYPSKVGKLFCERDLPFREEYGVAFWRALTNLKSLVERGLDPLQVLIDRAHEKDLDFIASVRMGELPEMNPDHLVANGGRGLAHEEVRDFLFAIFEELTTNYDIQGIELDFSAWPAIGWFFKPEEARENASMLTDWVGRIAELVLKSDPSRTVGARILPHEAMNYERGLDVRDWLENGLVDFVVPMCYYPSLLDQDPPVDWIIEAAHANDASVYGFLHPDRCDGTRQFEPRAYATPEMFRAAAANYIDLGVDGLYTWFLPWPFGGEQRAWLAEMGDWRALAKGDKHYRLRRRNPDTAEIGYDAPLPVQIPFGRPGHLHEIPFYVSDDLQAEADRVQRVTLRINISDLVTADRLSLLLNGESLQGERCVRSTCSILDPYMGQWLEFDLVHVRPRRGRNVLAVSLDQRPPGLECDIRVDDVDILIEYGFYVASGPAT